MYLHNVYLRQRCWWWCKYLSDRRCIPSTDVSFHSKQTERETRQSNLNLYDQFFVRKLPDSELITLQKKWRERTTEKIKRFSIDFFVYLMWLPVFFASSFCIPAKWISSGHKKVDKVDCVERTNEPTGNREKVER